jgi:nucleoside phosphorylase
MAAYKAIVLTALSVEYKAVRRHLHDTIEIVHPFGTIYESGNFIGNKGTNWQVGLAEIGAGNPGAAAEAERAIAFFKPEVALFIGVAGGIKDVAIGDVVVGTKIYGYESGKVAREFEIRPIVFNSSYELQQRARAEAKREDWLERTNKSSPSNFRAFVAPIAAGEKVVSSRKSTLFTFIHKHYGDALAVEMEGRGFLEAAHANQQVRALVIRGISDLIDRKTETDSKGAQELAAQNASGFAFEVLAKFSPQPSTTDDSAHIEDDKPDIENADILAFEPNIEVESLIRGIELGDWDASADAAIQVIGKTLHDGTNPIYGALLKYYSSPSENLRWAATQVVECTVALSPHLLDRGILARLAIHRDFSIRASAASICMELANVEPSRVPLDILIPLSSYNEDWYVQAPANAALKTMLGAMPGIYRIFRARLRSSNADEREHAASILADIARKEAQLLDAKDLQAQIKWLRASKDRKAADILAKILPLVRRASHRSNYKYGL